MTMNTYERFMLALDALHREYDTDATLREVAALLSLRSISHVAWLRDRLRARGLVTYRAQRQRTLRLTAAGQDWVDVRTGRRRIA